MSKSSNGSNQNSLQNLAGITLALAPIARSTFDVALAQAVTDQVRAQLSHTGLTLTGPQAMLSTLEEAKEAAALLAQNPPDVVLALQSTFADSTMVMELAQTVDAPLLLWAIPEAHTGGRLRLNSLCGINLAGHALTRAGYRYDTIFAAPDNPAAMEKVAAVARAGKVKRLLQQARLGRLGEHPAGFDTCQFDAGALQRQLGVNVVQLELSNFFEQVRAADPQAVDAVARKLGQSVGNLAELDQTATRGTLGAYVTLQKIAAEQNLNGFAMRCWPEFFTELGCAACGAMSMLSNEHTPCSCEVDVNGTITQLMLQWLSGQPAFGTDLVSVDEERDALVIWHCGLAPTEMADPAAAPRGTIHSNRKLPLLMEFPLKPGRVTVARLSEATGGYRLVVGSGEMVQAPPSFSGTSGVLRFDHPAHHVLDTILSEGLEHHLTLTYGDHVPALLALTRMLNIPVLRL
jgi:L-fucose isomerase-like protein